MSTIGHSSQPLFHLFGLEVTGVTTTTWGIMLVLTVLAFVVNRKVAANQLGRTQLAAELVVDSLINFLGGIVGSRKVATRFFPILGSYFLIILVSNYSGLLPGMGRVAGMQAPTSSWSYTLGVSLTVFFGTYIVGYKHHKAGYFKHYLKPMVFMLPLILMEEIVRPLSLSLRLYGNVYGEEAVVENIFHLAPLIVPIPFMFLGVFFGFMQALVFTLLTATYLAEAFEGEEE